MCLDSAGGEAGPDPSWELPSQTSWPVWRQSKRTCLKSQGEQLLRADTQGSPGLHTRRRIPYMLHTRIYTCTHRKQPADTSISRAGHRLSSGFSVLGHESKQGGPGPGCQLDWICNQLRGELLAPVRDFLRQVPWGRRHTPSVGRTSFGSQTEGVSGAWGRCGEPCFLPHCLSLSGDFHPCFASAFLR